jgi:uncharacterized membrane protein YagU involved in acid resistance
MAQNSETPKLKLFGNDKITDKDISATIALIIVSAFSFSFIFAVIFSVIHNDMEMLKFLFAAVTPFVASVFAFYLGYKANASANSNNSSEGGQ